jgi:hypothetical protein
MPRHRLNNTFIKAIRNLVSAAKRRRWTFRFLPRKYSQIKRQNRPMHLSLIDQFICTIILTKYIKCFIISLIFGNVLYGKVVLPGKHTMHNFCSARRYHQKAGHKFKTIFGGVACKWGIFKLPQIHVQWLIKVHARGKIADFFIIVSNVMEFTLRSNATIFRRWQTLNRHNPSLFF